MGWREALTDELTGLFNEGRFREVLSLEVEHARRTGQSVSVVMLDIDDLNAVEEKYGHEQARRVLREVSGVLQSCAREVDEPARYGDDRLIMVLPGAGLDEAYEFGEDLRRRVEGVGVPLAEGDGALHVTVSLGVAAAPVCDQIASEDLLERVHAALYEAKRSGKNRTARASIDTGRAGA